MSEQEFNVPVPVLKYPHWRVNIRPGSYEPNLIPTLKDCYDVIEQAKVRLRGWDYPHLSHRQNERAQGTNWVACWSDSQGQFEYWRFYQSAQFLHLFSVREATEPAWREQLGREARSHFSHLTEIDWSQVPGCISFVNTLYRITEIFEFAARLAQRGVYEGLVSIRIDIKKIKGFVLMAGFDRIWTDYYAASEEELGKTWQIASTDLISASAEHSLAATSWFLERFGWLEPSIDVLRKDQGKFLKREL
jgi:hypothetical protein